MKKLPIGIQTFAKIREDDFVYIDKTDIALKLIKSGGGYFFLSRPRRFGKSLFLSTLKSIFRAEKALFKGLYIYDKYDWRISYPVIHISFGAGGYQSVSALNQNIKDIVRYNEDALKIKCGEKDGPETNFIDLIKKSFDKYKQKVVILIDEYDKPILDNIDNSEMSGILREHLKNFYSVIKENDEFIKFTFITGVSKFSKVSLFSGLNNLNDITIASDYATICGYTQKDIEDHFSDRLKNVDRNSLQQWYNGYSWLGDPVYNPFGFLCFLFNNCVFENYWFSTATPTFLIKLIKKRYYHVPNLEKIVMDKKMLESFDTDKIELETIMWQSGYLTIKDVIRNIRGSRYILSFPNNEVRMGFNDHIIDLLARPKTNHLITQDNIFNALYNEDMKKLETSIKSLFASITYQNFTKNEIDRYEGFYASVIYAYLASLGMEVYAEDTTNRGRIDLTLRYDSITAIFEFKVDHQGAMKQLKEMRYHEKYMADSRSLTLIAIEFSSKERNIVNFEWQKIK